MEQPNEQVTPDNEGITRGDRDAAARLSELATTGLALDADRIWLQIEGRLDEYESPPDSLLLRTCGRAGSAFRRAARFATITGGGWGGPAVVGLFAILVIAALIAARTSEGPGLG